MYYQDENNGCCQNQNYPCENNYPNEKMYCECKIKTRKQRKCCIDVVIFILSVLFALTLGLIIGSIPAVATVLFAALAALIVLAVVFLIGIIVRIIELVCSKKCNR